MRNEHEFIKRKRTFSNQPNELHARLQAEGSHWAKLAVANYSLILHIYERWRHHRSSLERKSQIITLTSCYQVFLLPKQRSSRQKLENNDRMLFTLQNRASPWRIPFRRCHGGTFDVFGIHQTLDPRTFSARSTCRFSSICSKNSLVKITSRPDRYSEKSIFLFAKKIFNESKNARSVRRWME